MIINQRRLEDKTYNKSCPFAGSNGDSVVACRAESGFERAVEEKAARMAVTPSKEIDCRIIVLFL